jgi:hypothetical protein
MAGHPSRRECAGDELTGVNCSDAGPGNRQYVVSKIVERTSQ